VSPLARSEERRETELELLFRYVSVMRLGAFAAPLVYPAPYTLGVFEKRDIDAYLVEPVVRPTVAAAPNGAPSPQLQQFAQRLAANPNAFKRRGLRLEQVIEVGPAALLLFKQ
jgi:hypothetical protein